MHRFFVKGFLPDVAIKQDDINHIKNVLRKKSGDEITVIDEAGHTAIAVLALLSDTAIELEIKKSIDYQSEPPVRAIIGQGIGKGDKMDFVVQKAVELGATDIVPLMMERTVVRYDEKKAKDRRDRWQKIAVEAAKQSKRTVVPTVHPILGLTETVETFNFDLGIMLWEEEKNTGLREILKKVDKDKVKTVFLLVGPEGGISEKEAEAAKNAGFASASLGKRVLRTETAGIAAISVMMYEIGGFGDV